MLGAWSLVSERDASGRCSALAARNARGVAEPLATLAYDPAGGEVSCKLPGGGSIEQARDAHGNVIRASVFGKGNTVVRPGEPDWVGRQGGPDTLRFDYRWSPAGQLEELADRDRGAQRFAHDARGRIAQTRHEKRSGSEDYILSPRGDLRGVNGRAQFHTAGGRLVATAGATLSYDLRGRLVKKVEGAAVTTYEWNVLGLLTRVTLPDRTRVELVYDAFARRLEKRVVRPGELVRHRYRWDLSDLLEETVERRTTNGGPAAPYALVERRRYAYALHTPWPLAQAIDTEAGPGPWNYLVHRDGAPVPLALVRGDGTVDDFFETEAYGRVIAGDPGATLSRFPGHWYDPETGLHYNRWRYFDPGSGTYLSPEPLGLLGGIESYGYVQGQPLLAFDPDGLTSAITTLTGADGSPIETGSSGSTYKLHPAVAAALPIASARSNKDIDAASCSEPAALSKYLNNWEKGPPERSCDPGVPGGRQNLNKALSEVKGIGTKHGSKNLAACPNCSQTISRLHALADPPLNDKMPTVADGQVNTANKTNVPGGLQNPDEARTVYPKDGSGPIEKGPSELAQNKDNPAMAAANEERYKAAGGAGSVAGLNPGVYDNSSGTWKNRQ